MSEKTDWFNGRTCSAVSPDPYAQFHPWKTTKKMPGWRKAECPHCARQLVETEDGVNGG